MRAAARWADAWIYGRPPGQYMDHHPMYCHRRPRGSSGRAGSRSASRRATTPRTATAAHVIVLAAPAAGRRAAASVPSVGAGGCPPRTDMDPAPRILPAAAAPPPHVFGATAAHVGVLPRSAFPGPARPARSAAARLAAARPRLPAAARGLLCFYATAFINGSCTPHNDTSQPNTQIRCRSPN